MNSQRIAPPFLLPVKLTGTGHTSRKIAAQRPDRKTINLLKLNISYRSASAIRLRPLFIKSKCGPASTLEKQIEQISQLPRAKQKFVMEMLDTVIQQAS